jgi:hypothetical protein
MVVKFAMELHLPKINSLTTFNTEIRLKTKRTILVWHLVYNLIGALKKL